MKKKLEKKTVLKKEKPLVILELEQLLRINLIENSRENFFNNRSRRSNDFFVVNENNDIIALSISHRP